MSRRGSRDRVTMNPPHGQLPQLSYPRTVLLGGDAPNGSPHRSKGPARFSQSLSGSPYLDDDRALYLRDNIAEPLKAVMSPVIGKYLGGADSSMLRPQTISFPAAPTFWQGTPSKVAKHRPPDRGASASPGLRSSTRSRTGTGQARGGGHLGDDEGWGDPLGAKLLEEFAARLVEVHASETLALSSNTGDGSHLGEAGVGGLGESPAGEAQGGAGGGA
ncbi:hypothetical protein T484DRAFT_1794991, partial [Baffinella frigidus]